MQIPELDILRKGVRLVQVKISHSQSVTSSPDPVTRSVAWQSCFPSVQQRTTGLIYSGPFDCSLGRSHAKGLACSWNRNLKQFLLHPKIGIVSFLPEWIPQQEEAIIELHLIPENEIKRLSNKLLHDSDLKHQHFRIWTMSLVTHTNYVKLILIKLIRKT